jgi:hypothetical protein
MREDFDAALGIPYPEEPDPRDTPRRYHGEDRSFLTGYRFTDTGTRTCCGCDRTFTLREGQPSPYGLACCSVECEAVYLAREAARVYTFMDRNGNIIRREYGDGRPA